MKWPDASVNLPPLCMNASSEPGVLRVSSFTKSAVDGLIHRDAGTMTKGRADGMSLNIWSARLNKRGDGVLKTAH